MSDETNDNRCQTLVVMSEDDFFSVLLYYT